MVELIGALVGLFVLIAVPYVIIRGAVRSGVRQANQAAQPNPRPRRDVSSDPIPANWSPDLDAEIERNLRK